RNVGQPSRLMTDGTSIPQNGGSRRATGGTPVPQFIAPVVSRKWLEECGSADPANGRRGACSAGPRDTACRTVSGADVFGRQAEPFGCLDAGQRSPDAGQRSPDA